MQATEQEIKLHEISSRHTRERERARGVSLTPAGALFRGRRCIVFVKVREAGNGRSYLGRRGRVTAAGCYCRWHQPLRKVALPRGEPCVSSSDVHLARRDT